MLFNTRISMDFFQLNGNRIRLFASSNVEILICCYGIFRPSQLVCRGKNAFNRKFQQHIHIQTSEITSLTLGFLQAVDKSQIPRQSSFAANFSVETTRRKTKNFPETIFKRPAD